MNEETELGAAYKEQQKQERAKRRAQAEQQLKDRGINYTVHNDGAHIVIEEGGATFDFWPGTVRWRMRPHKSQYGVPKLLSAITQRRLIAADFAEKREQEENAFVERMTRAFPHLKGEAT